MRIWNTTKQNCWDFFVILLWFCFEKWITLFWDLLYVEDKNLLKKENFRKLPINFECSIFFKEAYKKLKQNQTLTAHIELRSWWVARLHQRRQSGRSWHWTGPSKNTISKLELTPNFSHRPKTSFRTTYNCVYGNDAKTFRRMTLSLTTWYQMVDLIISLRY